MPTGHSRLFNAVGIAIAVIVVLGAIFVAVNLANDAQAGGGSPGSGGPGSNGSGTVSGTCSTKCIFFKEYRCEDGALLGKCLGAWSCSGGLGQHPCQGQNQGPVTEVILDPCLIYKPKALAAMYGVKY